MGLLRLIAAAEVPAAETAFVGDSAIDVRTARAAGTCSIGVTYGFDPAAFDAHAPDAQVSHPQDLPALFV